eukprot:366483-Chlamydomonas_euryale.AAC.6
MAAGAQQSAMKKTAGRALGRMAVYRRCTLCSSSLSAAFRRNVPRKRGLKYKSKQGSRARPPIWHVTSLLEKRTTRRREKGCKLVGWRQCRRASCMMCRPNIPNPLIRTLLCEGRGRCHGGGEVRKALARARRVCRTVVEANAGGECQRRAVRAARRLSLALNYNN